MTLNTTAVQIPYTLVAGTPTTGFVYTFPFRVVLASDLVISATNISTGAVATLVLGSDYTITGLGSYSGGSITLLKDWQNNVLLLYRMVPLTQQTSLVAQGAFFPEIHEAALDKLTMVAQQIQDQLARSPVVPSGATPSGGVPTPVQGTILGWVNGTWAWLSAATSQLAANLLTSASNMGTTLVTHLAPFAGAVGRLLNAKLAEVPSILDFGAVGNGITDDTAAINAALAASKHVIVPAGMTPLVTSAITMPIGTRLHFLGGLGNENGAFPASYLIKASSMTTPALILQDRCLVEGGGVVCQATNTGDGVAIWGNSAKIRYSLVHGAGGVGIRVGNTAGTNSNSFCLDHVTSQYNGGDGVYVHDGSNNINGPNANAGTITQPFCHHNTGHGIHLGNSWWDTILNGLTEHNSGYGLYIDGTVDATGQPECRFAHIIGGDYNESNTAGAVYDNGYYSTFVNPDHYCMPTNATSGNGGFRNFIGGQVNTLAGLTVNSGNSYAVFTAQGANGSGITYPALVQKICAGSNGDGAGLMLQVSVNGGTSYRQQAAIASWQITTGYDGLQLIVNKNGTMTVGATVNLNSNWFAPGSDNAYSLGGGGVRWSQLYAATATINTSDERDKEQIAPVDAAVLRAWAKVDYYQWRYRDAVAKKGDGARIHHGLIAQRVKAAFEAEGVDPFQFGILCWDEWDAEPERTITMPCKEGETPQVVTVPATPAGDRYGIRYEEALALECAYLRSRLG